MAKLPFIVMCFQLDFLEAEMAEIIVGLDPGTVRTGFAVATWEKNKFSLLDFGVLSAASYEPLEQRLFVIGEGLKKIYQQYSVSDTAIEQVFFGKNPDSAFKLGQIFGLCVYQAICAGSSVFPYAARYVKKSITGSGSADKKAVQTFVLIIFGVKTDKVVNDATDALAVALCHIYQKQNPNLQALSSSVQINIGSGK